MVILFDVIYEGYYTLARRCELYVRFVLNDNIGTMVDYSPGHENIKFICSS